MSKLNNTILGVNISHDTSIAVVKNGVLVDVFEEERCRRKKYWSPKEDEKTLLLPSDLSSLVEDILKDKYKPTILNITKKDGKVVIRENT